MSDRSRALVTAELSAAGRERLEQLGYDVACAGWGATRRTLDGDGLVAAGEGATLLVVEVERVDAGVLQALPEVRIVASARGVPSNVDLAAATARGVPVLHTPARNAASVADFTIGLVLAQCRSLARGQDHLRRRGWLVDGELPYLHFRGPELAGRTMGLVGYGAVGREVARRAAGGFGMRVLVNDPYVAEPELPAEAVALERLLAESDVVSLHCPLTPETTGMIAERQLALLRPEAVLVNTARAAVVDEAALVAALAEGRIAGAALDVFWTEPLPPDHPLLGLDNVTLTPHLAGAADDVVTRHSAMIADDVARLLAGRRPVHLANPEVWDR
ncbi:MAG TPA: NAD(P)-dependent oxidoreductase [Acidimicrobiales bacterium]|nr:NAD(P)-dependent oxidoreductase [Acidimicrobiales bacterium]